LLTDALQGTVLSAGPDPQGSGKNQGREGLSSLRPFTATSLCIESDCLFVQHTVRKSDSVRANDFSEATKPLQGNISSDDVVHFSASVIGLEWSDSVALSQQQTMRMSSAGQSQGYPRTSK
jgi:hypothetical protein